MQRSDNSCGTAVSLSIASELLKPASKIWTEVVSPVPKQAAQIREPLASFPQWNWDRKEAAVTTTAGNTRPSSCKSEPEAQAAAGTPQHGSCPKPGAQALEAVRAALGCHWDPWHPSYPLILKKMFAASNHFPRVPAHSYVQEPIFALFKALLGKGAVNPIYTAPQAGPPIYQQCVFLFCKGKHSFPLQSKAGIYNEPNSAKFPNSCAPRTFKEEQICLYSKWISSIAILSSTML